MSKTLKDLLEPVYYEYNPKTEGKPPRWAENMGEMARRLRKLDEKCKNASAVAYDPHSETTPLILKVSEVRSILDGEE